MKKKIPFYKVKVGQKIKFDGLTPIYTRIRVSREWYGKTGDVHCLMQDSGMRAYCPLNTTTKVTIVE